MIWKHCTSRSAGFWGRQLTRIHTDFHYVWIACLQLECCSLTGQMLCAHIIFRPRKNMCGSGYPTYPKCLPPTRNFFSKFWSWKRLAEQNDFLPASASSDFGDKIYITKNDHLKRKSKCICIQSLVLEVKGLKHGYILKNRPFYISFVLFNALPSRSEYFKKKKGNRFYF